MPRDTLKRLFLLINYIAVACLAVMAIVQIWFEVWENWEIFIKAITTYLVILAAGAAINASDGIAKSVFGNKTDEQK